MKIVNFLEKEWVIRSFGIGLIGVPFLNTALNFWLLKSEMKLSWGQINFWASLAAGSKSYYFLAVISVIIGTIMLKGSRKAWTYVMVLIGAQIVLQILNLDKTSWRGPLAWPSFIFNIGLFLFILDQLVWKVMVPGSEPTKKHILNLNSNRRILFSFGATTPWGQLKTLSSEELMVQSFAAVPSAAENQIIEIHFSKEVVIEIQFARKEQDRYYFKPLNMDKSNVQLLNQWLHKIAV